MRNPIFVIKSKALVTGALLLFALLAAGCRFDTSAIPPDAATVSVAPPNFCPGESVNVRWDISQEEGCRSRHGITSEPLFGDGPPICSWLESLTSSSVPVSPVPGEDETTGSRTVFPPLTTRFSLTAWLCNTMGCLSVTDVVVARMVEGGGTLPSYTFVGGCSGGEVTYRAVDLRRELSACLAVEQICASDSNRGAIRIEAEGSAPATLEPGQCTPNFNGEGKLLTASPADLVAIEPSIGFCGELESSARPPDFEVFVSVACDSSLADCDVGSASEAILSEPADDDGEPTTFCNVAETCGDGVCDEFCEDITNCAADCAVSVPEAVCGDGILVPEEQCEEDSHCSTGFFCGDPGTNAPCVCVSLSTLDDPPAPDDEPVPGADGSLCGDGICQAGESPDWCGDCTSGDGGDDAVCGDGVCSGGEDGTSCSTDCGPI